MFLNRCFLTSISRSLTACYQSLLNISVTPDCTNIRTISLPESVYLWARNCNLIDLQERSEVRTAFHALGLINGSLWKPLCFGFNIPLLTYSDYRVTFCGHVHLWKNIFYNEFHKVKSRWTGDHLQANIRIAPTIFKPRFGINIIAEKSQLHKSHDVLTPIREFHLDTYS